jgi:hypothetical protein
LRKRASLYRHGLITIAAVALPVALSAQASATQAPVKLTPAQIQAIVAKAAARARNVTTPVAPNGFPGNRGPQAGLLSRAGAAPADDDSDSNEVSASAFGLWINDPNSTVSNWNDLGFEGYEQDTIPDIVNGAVYPDETLTATAIIFNEDDTCPLYAAGPPPPCTDADYNVDVSWQVGCNYTVTNFDLGQVVSAPTLFTWSYGYPGMSGTPVQLTFTLTPQMCGGDQAPGENFSLQAFTQVEGSTSYAQDQVTLAYEQATP